MFAAIYDLETGIIRIGAGGPDETYFASLLAEGEGFLVSETPVDNATQKVDIETLEFVSWQPAKTVNELKAEMIKQVQIRLDSFAQTRGYDNILSAATYATSSVPSFAAEGQYAVDARDQTWSALYEMLAEVMSGARALPESFADIEDELPALEWAV